MCRTSLSFIITHCLLMFIYSFTFFTQRSAIESMHPQYCAVHSIVTNTTVVTKCILESWTVWKWWEYVIVLKTEKKSLTFWEIYLFTVLSLASNEVQLGVNKDIFVWHVLSPKIQMHKRNTKENTGGEHNTSTFFTSFEFCCRWQRNHAIYFHECWQFVSISLCFIT